MSMTALLDAKRAPSILDVLAIAIAIFSALVFLPPFCFGSIYYHLGIGRAGLFWDRLPMAVGFIE